MIGIKGFILTRHDYFGYLDDGYLYKDGEKLEPISVRTLFNDPTIVLDVCVFKQCSTGKYFQVLVPYTENRDINSSFADRCFALEVRPVEKIKIQWNPV